MTSPELLTAFESCQRAGYYSRRWESHRLRPIEMVRRAVLAGLQTDRSDFGEAAGEEVLDLAHRRGLDIESQTPYPCAINHAAIADIVVSAIRKPDDTPWKAAQCQGWTSAAFLDSAGTHLRRFLPVSHWNEERKFFETHSWFVLGEVCHFRLPMQLVVAVIGPISGGRRTGYWSKALLHPRLSNLRFKLRARSTVDNFRETWLKIYREEHGEIEREKWLQAMLDDGVLQESLFVVNITVPEESERLKIVDLASRQLERLRSLKDLPPKQLSTCFDVISPCPFRMCCHSEPETQPEDGGFDRL